MIEAVCVNHNTSPYAELMLRSFFATHAPGVDLALTILDNDSDDQVAALRA